MGSLLQSRNLGTDIADYCQAMYFSTDADTALRVWMRLRQCLDQKAHEEEQLFLMESRALRAKLSQQILRE